MNIERIRIPDNDAHNWINTLRAEGFSQEEIDYLMSRTNRTYARMIGAEAVNKDEVVEQELKKIEDYLIQQGKDLPEAMREVMRNYLESQIRL